MTCKRTHLMDRWISGILGIALGLGVVLVAPASHAAGVLDGQPSIRSAQRVLDGRHAVAPIVGFTVNDDYSRNVVGGIGWRYFVTRWLGVGLDAMAGLGLDTSLTESINDAVSSDGKPFQLSTSSLRFAGFASLEVIPLQGKFNVLDLFHARIDLHLNMGFGMAMIAGNGRIEASTSMVPTFGAGFRVFPTDWVGISFDFRDMLINRVVSSRRDGSLPAPQWGQNWLATVSVGFFFPTEPESAP